MSLRSQLKWNTKKKYGYPDKDAKFDAYKNASYCMIAFNNVEPTIDLNDAGNDRQLFEILHEQAKIVASSTKLLIMHLLTADSVYKCQWDPIGNTIAYVFDDDYVVLRKNPSNWHLKIEHDYKILQCASPLGSHSSIFTWNNPMQTWKITRFLAKKVYTQDVQPAQAAMDVSGTIINICDKYDLNCGLVLDFSRQSIDADKLRTQKRNILSVFDEDEADEDLDRVFISMYYFVMRNCPNEAIKKVIEKPMRKIGFNFSELLVLPNDINYYVSNYAAIIHYCMNCRSFHTNKEACNFDFVAHQKSVQIRKDAPNKEEANKRVQNMLDQLALCIYCTHVENVLDQYHDSATCANNPTVSDEPNKQMFCNLGCGWGNHAAEPTLDCPVQCEKYMFADSKRMRTNWVNAGRLVLESKKVAPVEMAKQLLQGKFQTVLENAQRVNRLQQPLATANEQDKELKQLQLLQKQQLRLQEQQLKLKLQNLQLKLNENERSMNDEDDEKQDQLQNDHENDQKNEQKRGLPDTHNANNSKLKPGKIEFTNIDNNVNDNNDDNNENGIDNAGVVVNTADMQVDENEDDISVDYDAANDPNSPQIGTLHDQALQALKDLDDDSSAVPGVGMDLDATPNTINSNMRSPVSSPMPPSQLQSPPRVQPRAPMQNSQSTQQSQLQTPQVHQAQQQFQQQHQQQQQQFQAIFGVGAPTEHIQHTVTQLPSHMRPSPSQAPMHLHQPPAKQGQRLNTIADSNVADNNNDTNNQDQDDDDQDDDMTGQDG